MDALTAKRLLDLIEKYGNATADTTASIWDERRSDTPACMRKEEQLMRELRNLINAEAAPRLF